MGPLIEIYRNLNLGEYTDKDTTHCYISYLYENEFARFQNLNISLLEIGISNGGSLKLWREYFKFAKLIQGIDNRPEFLEDQFSNLPGVKYLFHDAYDESIKNKLDNFDIIIDDGSHVIDFQLKAIDIYYPLLNKNGIYVIEDIEGTMKNGRDKMDYFFMKMLFFKKIQKLNFTSFEWLDLRHVKNRPDDTLLVIRK